MLLQNSELSWFPRGLPRPIHAHLIDIFILIHDITFGICVIAYLSLEYLLVIDLYMDEVGRVGP